MTYKSLIQKFDETRCKEEELLKKNSDVAPDLEESN